MLMRNIQRLAYNRLATAAVVRNDLFAPAPPRQFNL